MLKPPRAYCAWGLFSALLSTPWQTRTESITLEAVISIMCMHKPMRHLGAIGAIAVMITLVGCGSVRSTPAPSPTPNLNTTETPTPPPLTPPVQEPTIPPMVCAPLDPAKTIAAFCHTVYGLASADVIAEASSALNTEHFLGTGNSCTFIYNADEAKVFGATIRSWGMAVSVAQFPSAVEASAKFDAIIAIAQDDRKKTALYSDFEVELTQWTTTQGARMLQINVARPAGNGSRHWSMSNTFLGQRGNRVLILQPWLAKCINPRQQLAGEDVPQSKKLLEKLLE